MVIDDLDLVCGNCGRDDYLSRPSIQKGIGGLPIGFCSNCVEKLPKSPDADDKSEKADRARETIRKRTVVGTYRTRLMPLVERSQYRAKVKPVAAPTASLWGDEILP